MALLFWSTILYSTNPTIISFYIIMYTGIKKQNNEIEDELEMGGPKSIQTRFIGIITSTIIYIV